MSIIRKSLFSHWFGILTTKWDFDEKDYLQLVYIEHLNLCSYFFTKSLKCGDLGIWFKQKMSINKANLELKSILSHMLFPFDNAGYYELL